MTIKSHKDLEVWRLSTSLAADVYRTARKLPREEQFGLAAQLRQAAVSVPSNILEGYGRGTRGDYIRFLRTAQGSVQELDTQLALLVLLELAPSELIAPALVNVGRVGSMLNRLISSLLRTSPV